jgi:outer membrane murein-binding lipoprotein Lpp
MEAIKGNVLQMARTKAVLIMGVVLLAGCAGDGPPHVDTRSVALEVRIERLDQDLFHTRPDSMAAASLRAYATYGEFYRTYIEDILQGAPIEDPRLPMVLNRFVLDPDWSSVQEAIDNVLADMVPQQADFEGAFKRLKVLFPDSLTPRIIIFNSGFNYGIVPTDSVLGIGAEWFIGSDHPVVGYLAPEAFPQYVKDRMMPEMLVPSGVKGWLLVHYTRNVDDADVLTNLVEVGKVMALLDAVLPDTEPRYKFAFSKEQLAWCEANEQDIWKSIVEKLFSKSAADVGRLMNDGPFTNGLPRESPGHIGEWIGYRMVRAYMKANPKVTYQQLFELDDPRAILKHYKPR